MCGSNSTKPADASPAEATVHSRRKRDLEEYSAHVRQVMQAADWPWPEGVLLDPAKQPRFVHSVEEFMHEVLVGSHMNEIVVFPGGMEALGHTSALSEDAVKAIGYRGVNEPPVSRNAYEVLENMAAANALDNVKGKVTYRKTIEDRKDAAASGRSNGCLTEKWKALRDECPEGSKETVYLAELRRMESVPCNDGLRKKRKSTLSHTLRERLYQNGMHVRAMPFWDDFSEGVFCGAGCSGYDLHIDCIPSSNLGSIFAGHKMMAIWSYGDDSKAVMKSNGREQFVKPLSKSQVQALENACCVALAPPGSIYLFSGCNAHAVCNIGFSAPAPNRAPQPSLIVSSYESYVNLNVAQLSAVADRIDECLDDSSDEDIEDFQEEICEGAAEVKRRLEKGELPVPKEAAAALEFMRTSGIQRQRGSKAAEGVDSEPKSKKPRIE